MLVPARKFNHLRHLGLCDFIREYTTDSHPVAMHVQHDLNRVVPPFVEKIL
jgi:hypothetical protein